MNKKLLFDAMIVGAATAGVALTAVKSPVVATIVLYIGFAVLGYHVAAGLTQLIVLLRFKLLR
jgi:arginine exporter protein ArgO